MDAVFSISFPSMCVFSSGTNQLIHFTSPTLFLLLPSSLSFLVIVFHPPANFPLSSSIYYNRLHFSSRTLRRVFAFSFPCFNFSVFPIILSFFTRLLVSLRLGGDERRGDGGGVGDDMGIGSGYDGDDGGG